MNSIAFTVVGIPQPKGSTKGFGFMRTKGPRAGTIGVNITNDNLKAKGWAAVVNQGARAAFSGAPIAGPVRVEVTFFLPRPKGHFGKRGLKPSAPQYPIAKERNDTDKLARCALDALTAVIFEDDSQVVRLVAEKVYSDGAPGASFVIEPVRLP